MRPYVPITLALALAVGCGGHQSTTKNNSKSASSTSKDTGKIYTPDTKANGGGAAPGATSGAGNNAPMPQPAETIDNKPSPASDAGSVNATRGQAVMNPGAPVAHAPGKREVSGQRAGSGH